MNIRLSGNKVRFRISYKELNQLKEDLHIREETIFPGEKKVSYEINVVPCESSQIEWKENRLTLKISPLSLEQLISELPTKEGLSGKTPIAPDKDLEFFIEVDVKSKFCRVKRDRIYPEREARRIPPNRKNATEFILRAVGPKDLVVPSRN